MSDLRENVRVSFQVPLGSNKSHHLLPGIYKFCKLIKMSIRATYVKIVNISANFKIHYSSGNNSSRHSTIW